MSQMEIRIDFMEFFTTDVTLSILSKLDDEVDLVRAAAVSRSWRHFVIANGLARQLFVKRFPQLFSVCDVVTNASEGTTSSSKVETNDALEWEILEWDHKVSASLLHAITNSKVHHMDCIANAVSASSTGNYPNESIVHTLHMKDKLNGRASYWSSKGQSNPEVPETLIYKLKSELWAIAGFRIKPFGDFFQQGKPVYSSKSVRFRMGHPKSPIEIGSDLQHLSLHKPADDKFVWTYTSPEFPMMQENRFQAFKLPKPVLSNGGYLKVELLGRVQRQQNDRLFYIRLCCVEVVGRPLFPAFDLEIDEPSRTICNAVAYLRQLEQQMLSERITLLRHLLRLLQHQPNQ